MNLGDVMKNKRRQKIKIVIANPECLEAAQNKMIEYIYEEYIKKSLEEAASGIIKGIDVK